MSHPFMHPGAKPLLAKVAHLFKSEDTYISNDSNIVFVCGGPYASPRSMRRRFMDYAEKELPNLRMFLAENAEIDYVTHDAPAYHNVAEFEEIIGAVSDCVIIFPESVGSFAEIGYFAKNEEVRKLILVVHNAKLQSEDSFLLRGPIELIDRHSYFRPTIQLSYSGSVAFGSIKTRLEKRISTKRRKRFGSKEYKSLSLKEKLFIIYSLIDFFIYINVDGIEFAFKSVFYHANRGDINHLVSILVAANLIKRHAKEREYFTIVSNHPFMEFDSLNAPEFKLAIIKFYTDHCPFVADLIGVPTR